METINYADEEQVINVVKKIKLQLNAILERSETISVADYYDLKEAHNLLNNIVQVF